MFKLIICGFDEFLAIQEKQLYDPTCIVSLMSPNINVPHYGDHHLILTVDDVVGNDTDMIVPSKTHLETVLDFTKNLNDDDRVLIHCLVGQSRSTAIASAILIQHGMSYTEVLDHVRSIRDIAMPNAQFISIIDKHFGFNGNYSSYYQEWRKKVFKEDQERLSKISPKLILPGNIDYMRDILNRLK